MKFEKTVKDTFLNNLINKSVDDRNKNEKLNKKGFTLIELIIVVAVIAILITFSTISFASVNRRKATSVGKTIDSELTMLSSNAYSRDGAWRIEFEYSEDDECYILTHQYNTTDPSDNEKWVDFSSIKLSSLVSISFGGDEFDAEKSGGTHYISFSREKGKFLTSEDGNYFCDNIYVNRDTKVVTVHLSAESGGHRVID